MKNERWTMKRYILFSIIVFPIFLMGANTTGVVLDDNGEALIGANVYWLGTTEGVATDVDGQFSLPASKQTHYLVTSYTGYRNDTCEVTDKKPLTIVLVDDIILDEVVVTERKMSVLRSRTSAFDVQTLSGDELCKAACCNLSESFETSAAVDVAYSDAATGAKQIRLLGLSGTYVQLLNENTPGVRGLGQAFGLEYIPGSWMYSIQISKGTSSVINGYEAISGQINVELQKPQLTSPLAINGMLSSELNYELNLTGGWHFNKHVTTGVLAHVQNASRNMDGNDDGFLDMPKNTNANVVNRWNIHYGDYTGQIFVRYIYDHRMGGQVDDQLRTNAKLGLLDYKIDLRTNRIEGFMKNGVLLDEDKNSSIGLIVAASYHDQKNYYGNYRSWLARQTNVYFNGIFQTNFGDGRVADDDANEHKFSAGVSVNYDHYGETASDDWHEWSLTRHSNEVTTGLFAEYTYMYKDMLTLLVGVREDYSNVYEWFTTPRANLRFAPVKWWTIRGSVGLGYRSPNVIADNASFLVSNRWLITNMDVPQEQALNTGVSTTFYIPMGKKELQLSGEYYYTKFLEGVVADWDEAPNRLLLWYIGEDVQSFGHNWQVEANMEVVRGWTLTLAYRYTNVKNKYPINGVVETLNKPLTNKFKGIITSSYQTKLKKWQFDFTAQFNGYGRMPVYFTSNDNQYYTKGGYTYHKWYPQLLAQVTHFFKKASVYVGAENMTNFKQHNPIFRTGTDTDPYGDNFDAALVWGPINGWKVYAGFRWSIE